VQLALKNTMDVAAMNVRPYITFQKMNKRNCAFNMLINMQIVRFLKAG
jgi:hypothetical protein